MRAAAGAAVAPRNVHDTDLTGEFLLAAVVHGLQFIGRGEKDADRNIGRDRVIGLAFNLGHLFLRHHAAEVARNEIVVHVETHIVKAELLMNETGENMFSRVVLHIVVTTVPVKDAEHLGTDLSQ